METEKDEKSPIIQELIIILKDALKRAEDGKCSEAYVKGLLSGFNAESKGYYNDGSFFNYDEAMRETGIRDRTKLNDTCKTKGIKQVKISNHSVGFLKNEIKYLANLLMEKKKGK